MRYSMSKRICQKGRFMSYTKHLREDQFKRIESALPGFSGTVGRPVKDNRRFVEAAIWIGRNGGRWRWNTRNGRVSINALNALQTKACGRRFSTS